MDRVRAAAPRWLLREDPDAAATVTAALRRDGVTVHTGTEVTAIHHDRGPGEDDEHDQSHHSIGSGQVELADDTRISFDRLLVAVGRRPRGRDVDLTAAGVQVNERGYLVVDRTLRTTNRRIWAPGDITGHPQFTHVAGVHGSLAASNAILGLRRRVDLTAVPRVTFTQPELAAVGVGTLDTADTDRHSGLTVHEHVDRAVTDAHTDGLPDWYWNGKSRILGATVVGPRAGEALVELVLAVHLGLRARDLTGTMHAYPTYTYGAWDAALAEVRDRLHRPLAAHAVAALRVVRRRWIDVRD